jgi:microsomal dipeptidase-like Zn-dependent dipeptidase
MRTRVNPDPHSQGFTSHPKNDVTAILSELSDLAAAIRSLNQAGFFGEQVSVFTGREGLAKLDLHGEEHGFLAQVIRAVESLTTEERANTGEIEEGLRRGKFFVAVHTDGSEEQKTRVERLLKFHNAHHLRYFGSWTVERL